MSAPRELPKDVADHVLTFIRRAQAAAEGGSAEHDSFIAQVLDACAVQQREARASGGRKGSRQRARNGGLTDRERAFPAHYVRTRNLADAALASGFSGNRHTLRSVGYELRHRPDIAAEIERLDEQLAGQAVMTRREILDALAENVEAARSRGKFAASNQALKLIGHEQHGMWKPDAFALIEEFVLAVKALMRPESYADLLRAVEAQGVGTPSLPAQGVVGGSDDTGLH